MFGARGQLAVAQALQKTAKRCLTDSDTIFVINPTGQIDETPPNNAMDGGNGTTFNHPNQCLSLLGIQLGARSFRFPVQKPVRAMLIEPLNPIPNDLYGDISHLRRVHAPATVVYGRQRQQASNLLRIPASPRQGTQ
jgi:hypothetical protein